LYRTTPSECSCDEAGFTIIEALIALAVVAASLAAIGSLIATSVRGARALEQHVALVRTARTIVTGLPKRDELAPGSLSGDLAGYRWRVDIAPFGGAEAASPTVWEPQAILVTVRSASGAVLRLTTVRLSRRPGG